MADPGRERSTNDGLAAQSDLGACATSNSSRSKMMGTSRRSAATSGTLAVGGFARNAWQVQAPAVLDHIRGDAQFFQSHGYPLNRCRAKRVSGSRRI